MLLSSQCPLRRDVSYIVSIPEDTILRVAIDRSKMRQHPPAEPNYITRGNGHIVWERGREGGREGREERGKRRGRGTLTALCNRKPLSAAHLSSWRTQGRGARKAVDTHTQW